MCIRDSVGFVEVVEVFLDLEVGRARGEMQGGRGRNRPAHVCLLYTSDAADERSSVDLGGRRIIKKKNNTEPARPACSHDKRREKTNERAMVYRHQNR